jgi:hypothetical protein
MQISAMRTEKRKNKWWLTVGDTSRFDDQYLGVSDKYDKVSSSPIETTKNGKQSQIPAIKESVAA